MVVEFADALSNADLSVENGASRRHCSVSAAPEQPTVETTVSYVAWPRVISPVGTGEPDCMNAPRKSPSVFPPFVTICRETDSPPALSPHLHVGKGIRRS